jgi:hypothetical protein
MLKTILNTKIKVELNCTKVYDGYKVKDINKLVDEIIKIRKENKYKVTRTKKSYVSEIKAHNRLYKLGILRNHTKDTDMEENINKKNDILFRIIGL